MPTECRHSPHYVRNTAILGARLGADEMALLNAVKGKYYGLNAPALSIWEMLGRPRSLSEICAALMDEYEVDLPTCERETREILAEMLAEGLVSTVEA